MTDFERLMNFVKSSDELTRALTEIRLYDNGLFNGDIAVTIRRTNSFFFDTKGKCTDFYIFGTADNFEEAFRHLQREVKAA